ncbi:PTS sugar transporter subunit IIA [uncultured Methylobacterium sp.]|uniref:PTS sugar transporter subunit IIA n=1 Tax=uncultured Methylobacterium sp. TaxID=157278 RepID=UPI0035CC531E
MTIADLLSPDHVLQALRGSTKAIVLEEVARRASEALALDGQGVLSALRRREALGSTGVGDGIAIPHARLDQVNRPFGLLARLRAPVAFEAIDERPVDIVFLLLLPTNSDGAQLNALACVSRRLRDAETARLIRGARDASAMYAAMRGGHVAQR